MIRAEVHSDDHVAEANFDATTWFEQASNEEIRALAEISWGGDMESDAVAQFFNTDSERDVAFVFTYVQHKQDVGYECHVDSKDALRWIDVNRPHLRALLD